MCKYHRVCDHGPIFVLAFLSSWSSFSLLVKDEDRASTCRFSGLGIWLARDPDIEHALTLETDCALARKEFSSSFLGPELEIQFFSHADMPKIRKWLTRNYSEH